MGIPGDVGGPGTPGLPGPQGEMGLNGIMVGDGLFIVLTNTKIPMFINFFIISSSHENCHERKTQKKRC